MTSEILDNIKKFDPISLTEMDAVKLMNRVDTKFVFSKDHLAEILPILLKGYKILEIDGIRLNSYDSLYFDTPELKYYHDHHNGKPNRVKIRIRNYIESNLYFLEVKKKRKGRTDKKRIPLSGFEENLSEKSRHFIQGVLGHLPSLNPSLQVVFSRITLVSKIADERLTIDLDLTFNWQGEEKKYEDLVVAELKQGRANRESLFFQQMKKNGIRPNRMSKYCVGLLMMRSELKYNNFKKRLLIIEKIA